ncbi:hypothetical protein [Agarilytica rhodophyticola]|uniref:hypothetical protein n=1 Tax=Agarilytica rhodophyticola TaxID=1737490 RepID=UPI000B344153|nr:hypothetical protein [Agarilytica rhodophyticola]
MPSIGFPIVAFLHKLGKVATKTIDGLLNSGLPSRLMFPSASHNMASPVHQVLTPFPPITQPLPTYSQRLQNGNSRYSQYELARLELEARMSKPLPDSGNPLDEAPDAQKNRRLRS